MSNEVVTRVDADGNATVMLNRPEVHNAFDPAMTRLLTASLEQLDADPKVRAVVLLGAGRSFCAGADIGHMKASAKFSREQNYIGLSAHANIDKSILDETARRIADIRATAEGQEGLTAFLEKRKPSWVEPVKRATKKKTKKS